MPTGLRVVALDVGICAAAGNVSPSVGCVDAHLGVIQQAGSNELFVSDCLQLVSHE